MYTKWLVLLLLLVGCRKQVVFDGANCIQEDRCLVVRAEIRREVK